MRVMASALGGLVLFGFELLGICGGGEKEKKKICRTALTPFVFCAPRAIQCRIRTRDAWVAGCGS